jgi:hypothetical protein
MRRSAPALVLLLVSLLALFVARGARGETIDATFTTLVAGRQDPRDGNLYSSVPVFQNVSLMVSDVRLRHVDDLRVVVAGWGEVTLGAAPVLEGATGDLDLGFVEGKLFDRRLELRLGRQLVFGGAARAQPMDGASATARIWRRVYVNAYGGAPVTPRFGVHQGDFMAGGRMFWRPTVDSELGASFLEMLNDGLQARQDLGVDGRWRPLRSLTLTGYALFSLLELRLAEGDLAALWQPLSSLQLGADYRRTSPDLFLPRSSILSVFSQETRDEAGGNAWWRPISRLRIETDYHVILAEAGFGQRGGARVSASLGRFFETTLAAEVRFLRLATANGYVQERLYLIQRLSPAWVATLDLDLYKLEQPINGQTLSFTSAATLGWQIAPRWRAVVTGIADTTPQVERRFECMAKLVYNATYRVHQVRP